jgi:DNA repair protein RecN (Recombination protein N)
MLISLHIENIAVIERADIEFERGFNVLTGETGAGKSIVIDSIGAVLGGRTGREIVRAGAEKALVSAVFSGEGTESWLEENDIEPEDELIIQRKISPDGKSSCRVCGVPVAVQQLRSLGALLLDIHGQNDGRQLMDETRHRKYLDDFGGVSAEKSVFDEKYLAFSETKREMQRLTLDEGEAERLAESLKEQIIELENAQLRAGEKEELSERAELMKNSERLTEALDGAYAALYSNDESAAGLASEAEGLVRRAAGYAPALAETEKIITDARYMLEDAAERISDMRRGLDFSPEEYDRVQSRLSRLGRLEKKYRTDEQGLIERLGSCKARLDEIEYAGDRLIKLERELNIRREAVKKAAAALTQARAHAARELEERIVGELRYLSMPSVRFVVSIEPKAGENGFDSTGADEVRFLMSANAGETPGRISKIASGGELSRIMLAMKSVFAENDAVPSLVFDEIDTGVSGIAAQRVGEKMAEIAGKKQVICITHLPQIAALADAQFSISKAEHDGRTYTSVERLDDEGRVRELARLRDGEAISQTSLRAAQEQLENAQTFKAKSR